MSSVLTSPPSASSCKLLGRQHRLELRGGLAGLRAVRLVGDHREPLALRSPPARAPPSSANGKVWMVQTTIFLSPRERLRQLAALAAAPSPLIVATTPVVRSKSKIASCSCASITLRSETTSTVVEQLLVLGVVQVGEEVRRPRDRVGLARAGRVLDQVLAARALRPAPRLAASAWRRAGGSAGR